MAFSALTENTLPFAISQAFAELGGAQKSATIVSWVNSRYPNRWNMFIVRQNLRGCSVNRPTAIKYHPDFPRFLYCRGVGQFEMYDAERHGTFDYRGYPAGEAPEESDAVEEFRELTDELEGKREFAYEAHLRDYLARNLGILEAGLVLWTGDEDESTEYNIDGKRIDILAKDRQGTPVVIELKLSRGHEKTLGQALYYRGKLKKILDVSRVRIIMVASEITDELRIASGEVSDVDLFSYALTMQVQRVGIASLDN